MNSITITLLVVFSLSGLACIPPRIDVSKDGFADTLVNPDSSSDMPETTADLETLPNGVEDVDAAGDALGLDRKDDDSTTTADVVSPDASEPNDANDSISDVEQNDTEDSATTDTTTDLADTLPATACGDRPSCPQGFACIKQDNVDRCVCLSKSCGGCEVADAARECLTGEYCSALNRCRCGSLAESPAEHISSDRCVTGSYQCGELPASRCASGYRCQSGGCNCSVGLGSTMWCWQSPHPHGLEITGLYVGDQNEIITVSLWGTIMSNDGNEWRQLQSGTDDDLNDINGSIDGTVAVSGNNGVVLLRNGDQWSPIGPGNSIDFTGVWVATNDDLFVTGRDGSIWRRNKGSWTVSRIGDAGDELFDIWGSSASNIYAVGWKQITDGREPLTLRYDGQNWKEVSVDPSNFTGWLASIGHVWGIEENSVFLSSSRGLYFGGLDSWTKQLDPQANVIESEAVWGRSSSQVWAVKGLSLSTWNGAEWSTVNLDSLQGPPWLSKIAGNKNIFVLAGNSGYVVQNEADNWKVLRYNALNLVDRTFASGVGTFPVALGFQTIYAYVSGSWTQTLSLPSDFLIAAGYVSPTNEIFLAGTKSSDSVGLVRVGNSGVVGESYPVFPSADHRDCKAMTNVHGSSETNVIAVGCQGRIFRFDGSNWIDESLKVYVILSSVWVASESLAFIGEKDKILGRIDGSWTTSYQMTGTINAFWGNSETSILAVGTGGVILRYDGLDWKPMTSNTTEDLFAIWGAGDKDVFAVGRNVILHYDGLSWTTAASKPKSNSQLEFTSITGVGSKEAWIGTNRGIVHLLRE